MNAKHRFVAAKIAEKMMTLKIKTVVDYDKDSDLYVYAYTYKKLVTTREILEYWSGQIDKTTLSPEKEHYLLKAVILADKIYKMQNNK